MKKKRRKSFTILFLCTEASQKQAFCLSETTFLYAKKATLFDVKPTDKIKENRKSLQNKQITETRKSVREIYKQIDTIPT